MTGFIYAIESAGFVKLGYSEHPEKRFVKMATDSPFPCDMLGYWPGSKADEIELHGKFKDTRSRGEWFEGTPELREFVASNVVPPVERPSKRFTVHDDDSPLARWRKSNNLTQKELGDMLGICAPQLNHLEKGRNSCSLQVALKLRDLAGEDAVPLESLLVREPCGAAQ